MSSILWCLTIIVLCNATGIVDKITYISVEHPAVDYYNPIYLSNVSISSRRLERSNPVYYFNVGGRSHEYVGNNILFSFYFYEFLSNTYKRGFIEMHYRGCDMMKNDKFFGAALRKKMPGKCPYPPGYYYFANLTVSPAVIPKGFPFTKGRIYLNMSTYHTKEPVCSGHIDMELKQIPANNKDLFD